MRKIALLCLLLLCFSQLQAQLSAISVGWEPAFQGFGISFDRRVAPKSHWGFRVGAGFTSFDQKRTNNYREKGVTLPFEVNFLAGGKHHKFEAGMGTTAAYMWYRYDEDSESSHDFDCSGMYQRSQQIEHRFSSHEIGKFNQIFYLSAGYRLQFAKGPVVRAGFTLHDNLHINELIEDTDDVFHPYLSIGYTF